MVEAFQYAGKIWLTAVVAEPVAHFLEMVPWDLWNFGLIGTWVLILAAGGLAAIPTWFILGFMTWGVSNLGIKAGYKKTIISLGMAGWTWLPFRFAGFSDPNIPFDLTYWAIITFGIWFYQINAIVVHKSNIQPFDQFS
jgi:hypothetical protein